MARSRSNQTATHRACNQAAQLSSVPRSSERRVLWPPSLDVTLTISGTTVSDRLWRTRRWCREAAALT